MLRLLLFGVLSLALAADANLRRGDCDCADVAKGAWCATCQLGFAAADLGGATVYYCDGCEKAYGLEGKCSECGHPLTKKSAPKDACKRCLRKAAPAEICRKQGYVCPKCFKGAGAAGNCSACKTALVAGTVNAKLSYVCTGCKTAAAAAAKCSKAGCAQNGKDMTKTCSMSGKAPHAK